MKKLISVFCLALSVISLCSCTNQLHESTFFAMNTVMNVKIYGDKSVMSEINDCIVATDRLFDRSNPDSDIYKLNETKKAEVSPETSMLIKKSVELSEKTYGAFDITIAPVMDLWGFFNQQYFVPADEDLKNTLTKTGFNKISVFDNTITLTGDTSLDLGGIAKGHLSDKIAEIIKKHNITSAVMSLGGNVYCIGTKPNGDKWNVGIRSPKNSSELLCSVNISDCAVVTSGSYERYFEENGNTYHHIIDPKTGKPADNGLASVTVITKNAAYADALSTALFVMGMDKASELQKKLGDFEAIFITADNKIYITPGIEESFSGENYFVLWS